MSLRKPVIDLLATHLIGPLCDIVLAYARKHLVEYAVWEPQPRTCKQWTRPQYRLRDFALSREIDNGNYQLLTMHGRHHNMLYVITETDIRDVTDYIAKNMNWFPRLDIE